MAVGRVVTVVVVVDSCAEEVTDPMNFGSHMDGVVAVSWALVNVATPGERQGRPYDVPAPARLAADIGAALRRGSRLAADPPPSRVRSFVELAEAIRPVFELVDAGDLDAAAAEVNRLLERYPPAPRLERHDGQTWHLHYHGSAGLDRSSWSASIVLSLATVLGSEYAHRLGVCAAHACDRVFVDVSRNGTRRFCSTTCQNRVKVAAHRARHRG